MTQRDAARRATDLAEPPLGAGDALFLDVDGTLVGIADRPSAVSVDSGLIGLLCRLRDALGGALALISGRPLPDLDRLFHPERFSLAGQHGTERRSADGRFHEHALLSARLHAALPALRGLAHAHEGLLLEEKGHTAALHFRGAPDLAPLAEHEAQRTLAELGSDFELQAGKYVLELKPSGRNKGTAIAEFLDEPPFQGRVPVFVGDDLTDEYGFDLVNRRGGHSVKVGPGSTIARWRLADSDAVRRWLGRLASRIAEVAEPGAAR